MSGASLSNLSTHVLDTSKGHPVGGLMVTLFRRTPNGWEEIASGVTDADGRVAELASGLDSATYRLKFDTGSAGNLFYPEVNVVATLDGSQPHYHLPILLSPYGYTTYRGS